MPAGRRRTIPGTCEGTETPQAATTAMRPERGVLRIGLVIPCAPPAAGAPTGRCRPSGRAPTEHGRRPRSVSGSGSAALVTEPAGPRVCAPPQAARLDPIEVYSASCVTLPSWQTTLNVTGDSSLGLNRR